MSKLFTIKTNLWLLFSTFNATIIFGTICIYNQNT